MNRHPDDMNVQPTEEANRSAWTAMKPVFWGGLALVLGAFIFVLALWVVLPGDHTNGAGQGGSDSLSTPTPTLQQQR